MVTEISGAGLNHSMVGQLGAASAQRHVGSVNSDNAVSTQSELPRDKQVANSTQVAGTFAQLRVRQDALNKTASVVREVGSSVEQASQLLGKIENTLGEIVKMYPPYPVDSPQRISLLNNIDGLRKQVDALTFPPPESVEDAVRMLGAEQDSTNKDGVAVNADFVAGLQERMWDLPALDPASASDEEVSKALEQIKAAQDSLQELQAGMWRDVVSFVKQAETPEARVEASGVREQIANLGSRGIGSNASQLVQAAESQ